jgi:hypothetical protein
MTRPKKPTTLLLCKGCGATLRVSKAAIRRNFDEKPGYYLCHVCNRTWKHERPENTVLIYHYPSIGSFSAFTVRLPSQEEADGVLRAKALVAQVTWPNGWGDA